MENHKKTAHSVAGDLPAYPKRTPHTSRCLPGCSRPESRSQHLFANNRFAPFQKTRRQFSAHRQRADSEMEQTKSYCYLNHCYLKNSSTAASPCCHEIHFGLAPWMPACRSPQAQRSSGTPTPSKPEKNRPNRTHQRSILHLSPYLKFIGPLDQNLETLSVTRGRRKYTVLFIENFMLDSY